MYKNILKKAVLLLMMIGVISLAIVGCQKSDNNIDESNNEDINKENQGQDIILDDLDVHIGVIKGPTGMGMAKYIDENSTEDSIINHEFTIAGSPDELVAKIINGELDIAALPTNLASVLYNKTEGEIQIAAINTLGVSYLLENGNEINSFEDLKDKKIWVSGKGSVPEYAFDYLLKQNGLDPEVDVEIDYSLGHEELSAAVAAGDVKIALLPQPHVTVAMMKNQDIRIAIDLNNAWEEATENKSQLAMGCIVINKDFGINNKAFVSEFLKQYELSVNWVNDNPEEAGQLIAKHGILPNEQVAQKAIPNSSIVYIGSGEVKSVLDGFYKILFEIDPKALGGNLPDEAFYFTE